MVNLYINDNKYIYMYYYICNVYIPKRCVLTGVGWLLIDGDSPSCLKKSSSHERGFSYFLYISQTMSHVFHCSKIYHGLAQWESENEGGGPS